MMDNGTDPAAQDLSTEPGDREALLLKKVQKIRAQRRQLRLLQEEQDRLQDALDAQINASVNEQQRTLLEYRSLLLLKQQTIVEIEQAQQWNVLNDCFYISHNGPFGTINGQRLGAEAPVLHENVDEHYGASGSNGLQASATQARRSMFGTPNAAPSDAPMAAGIFDNEKLLPARTVRVPWAEINAALGYVALLLHRLEQQRHAGIRLRHEIKPQGNTSKIGVRKVGIGGSESVALYNLYSDDAFSLFGRRNFNIALSCLAQCVMDVASTVQAVDRTVTVPHVMEQNSRGDYLIGGVAVTYAADAGVAWTQAMKYLLTNLKSLLVFRGFEVWEPVTEYIGSKVQR